MQYSLDSKYPWAVDKAKLERAIAEVRGDDLLTNQPGTKPVMEAAVKKVYIRMLGKVNEVAEVKPPRATSNPSKNKNGVAPKDEDEDEDEDEDDDKEAGEDNKPVEE